MSNFIDDHLPFLLGRLDRALPFGFPRERDFSRERRLW